MIPWTAKKQILIFAIIAAVFAAGAFLIFFLASSPSCSDGKQNQDEEDIDCGGPCEPCLGEIKDLIILWSKPFKIKEGNYNVAAFVSNPNLFLGLDSARYQFRLYDEKNVLVAVREGEIFINPDEKYVIFESDIDSGNKEPKRATIEFEENLGWKRIEREKPQIVVSRKQIFYDPLPRLVADISNKSIFGLSGIDAVAVLYDSEKNAKAVSSTYIDRIAEGSTKDIVFTWPKPFSEKPESIEIYLRTNLTK